MGDNDDKILTKKEFKLKAQSLKLEEKQRKLEEKVAIKEEKERRKNSFGRKVRNFFLGIIFVIILVAIGGFFGYKFLLNKQNELFEKKMSLIYDKAKTAVVDKRYEEAIELLKSIEEQFSKYDEVKDTLNKTEQSYLNEYLTQATTALAENKFDKAVAALDSIEATYRKSDVVTDKYGEIYAAKLNYDVLEYAKDGKKNTLDILEYIVTYGTKDYEKFKDKQEELIRNYKDKFVLEARELMATDYISAKVKIDRASGILKDDKDIKTLQEELKAAAPKTESLISLKVSDTGKNRLKFEQNGSITDMAGKKYTKYIAVLSSYVDGNVSSETITYALDGKYKTLNAVFAKNNTVVSKKQSVGFTPLKEPKITVTCDGKVVYTSKDFDTSGTSMDVAIDLTDVKQMQITFEGAVKDTYFLANPELTLK